MCRASLHICGLWRLTKKDGVLYDASSMRTNADAAATRTQIVNPSRMRDGGSDLNRQKMMDLLAKGELYLFVGAGLSCRAGIPDWETLLKEFIACYEEQPDHSAGRAEEMRRIVARDGIEVFEVMLGDTAGEVAVITVLKRHFANETCRSLHERLLQLPFRGFITSNYDRCIEAACPRVSERIELTGNRWFCFPTCGSQTISVDEVFCGNPFLLHIHGCFLHQGSVEVDRIILTRAQYLKFYAEGVIQDILEQLAKKHLLLIGTSFTDQYFLDELRKFRRPRNMNEKANMPEWYILYETPQNVFPIRDRDSFWLHHIYYGNSGDRDGLAQLLSQMAEAVEAVRRPIQRLKDSDVEGLGGGQ
jgi:SIR2-like protein